MKIGKESVFTVNSYPCKGRHVAKIVVFQLSSLLKIALKIKEKSSFTSSFRLQIKVIVEKVYYFFD